MSMMQEGNGMRGRNRFVRGVLAGAVAGLLLAGTGNALEVGQKAPDFKLAASNGQEVKLADLLGKGPVVLYTFIQAFGGV
jgi:cytochrome oxidase Cu insertion factor (SCO1/SenC/PrrC family)